MNIIKHTASSLFWSYCFHSTLSLSLSVCLLLLLLLGCCPVGYFPFRVVWKNHWARDLSNSPLVATRSQFVQPPFYVPDFIHANMRVNSFGSLCGLYSIRFVCLSLSDVHPCRAWRVHGIAVQKRNIRGTLRKERLPSNICVYKHILQMQTRPIYDRASCTYSQFHVRWLTARDSILSPHNCPLILSIFHKIPFVLFCSVYFFSLFYFRMNNNFYSKYQWYELSLSRWKAWNTY